MLGWGFLRHHTIYLKEVPDTDLWIQRSSYKYLRCKARGSSRHVNMSTKVSNYVHKDEHSVASLEQKKYGDTKSTGFSSLQIIIVGWITLAVIAIVVLCVCLTGNCERKLRNPSPCTMECDNPHWGYHDYNGAQCWGSCYDICDANSQSPLDLRTSLASDISTAPLNMTGYDNDQSFTMANNGHTVNVDLLSSGNQMNGLGLPSTYRAYAFHMHWGATSLTGSEHAVNGRHYPMEMHVVHYNTIYPSPDEAASKPEGLAVLGFMFMESPNDNTAFDIIVNNLDQIKYKGDPKVQVGNQSLASLFPADFGSFFRYNGSLTTPPCYESVVWTVFTGKISISEQQLEKFRHLFIGSATEEEEHLVDNFRPVQQINKRNIYFGAV